MMDYVSQTPSSGVTFYAPQRCGRTVAHVILGSLTRHVAEPKIMYIRAHPSSSLTLINDPFHSINENFSLVLPALDNFQYARLCPRPTRRPHRFRLVDTRLYAKVISNPNMHVFSASAIPRAFPNQVVRRQFAVPDACRSICDPVQTQLNVCLPSIYWKY